MPRFSGSFFLRRILPLLFLFLTKGYSQSVTFNKNILSTVQNFTRASCVAPGGGFIVGADNMSLIRLDNTGNVSWGKAITPGNGFILALEDVCISSDSMYLLAGHALDFSHSPTTHEIMAAKVDTSGNLLWISLIDSTDQFVKTIALPSDDGGIIVCTSESSAPFSGDQCISLSRFSSSGGLVWHKIIRATGFLQNYLLDARAAGDGNYIASCRFDTIAMLLKFDPAGNVLWSRKNNSLPSFIYSPVEVATTATGMATIDKQNTIFFFDAAGNASGIKKYAAAGGNVLLNNLLSTSDGRLLAGGWFITPADSLLMVLKTDSAGNVNWAHTYDTTLYFIRDMIETPDGFLINRDIILTTHHDVGLIKTDFQGNSFCSENNLTVNSQSLTGLTSQNHSCVIMNGKINLVNPTCTVAPKVYSTSTICSVNGWEENAAPGWKIYPNPSGGIIMLEGFGSQEGSAVALYDAGGRCCSNFSFSNTCVLDLTSFAKGIYLLHITGEAHSYTAKIVLE